MGKVNRIRELREKQKISGVKLAEMFNISAQYLYELERGSRRLNEDLIIPLAKFFNVSTDYLLGAEEAKITISPPDMDKPKSKTETIKPPDGVVDQITELINDLSPKAQKELANYAQFLHTKQIFEGGEKESSATSEETA